MLAALLLFLYPISIFSSRNTKIIMPQCYGLKVQESNGVRVLDKAPEISGMAVIGGNMVEFTPEFYTGRNVVLMFYPGDFTFVCPTEIQATQKRIKEFENMDTVVIFISTDSVFSHLRWYQDFCNQEDSGFFKSKNKGKNRTEVIFLSDQSHKLSTAFGTKMDNGGSTRTSFIIDKDGKVRAIMSFDSAIGRSIDEHLRILAALREVEKGENTLCPVDWKPGDETIKPVI